MGKQFGSTIDLAQFATPAAAPASGRALLYVKSDNKVYVKDSGGNEILVGPESVSRHDPCRVATTGNITLSGTQTIDGVAVVANDRVLVRAQTNQFDNGIYVVAAGAWTRSTDATTAAQLTRGNWTYVGIEGTTNKNHTFTQQQVITTVGTDNQQWRVTTYVDGGGSLQGPATAQGYGHMYFNATQKCLQVHDGTTWVNAINFTRCTSSTRPGAFGLGDGYIIYETDTGNYYAFQASDSTWKPITGPHTHAAADLASGIVDVARLGTTPAATEYLKAGGATGSADWVAPSTIKTDLALTKTDVGLANVANVDQTNASNLTSGTVAVARMGSGTASTSTFLRGDNSWQSLSALPAYHGEWATQDTQTIPTAAFTGRFGWQPGYVNANSIAGPTPVGMRGSDAGANPGEFIIDNAGWYHVDLNLTFAGVSPAAGYRQLRLLQNGVQYQIWAFHTTTTNQNSMNGSCNIYCNAGDVLRPEGWQNSGAALAWVGAYERNFMTISSLGQGPVGATGAAGGSAPAGRCYIYNNTTQTFPDGTGTVAVFNTGLAANTAGMQDLANNRIKILTAGLYTIDASIWIAGATTTQKQIYLRVNATKLRENRVMGVGATSGHTVNATEWLAVNDLVDVMTSFAGQALTSSTQTLYPGSITASATLSVNLMRT